MHIKMGDKNGGIVRNGGTVRISKNFRKIWEEIRVQEISRGNINCSDSCISEILYNRIIAAGGLKQFF